MQKYIFDYSINIKGCKNGHTFNKILIQNFKKTQTYDEAEIKCEICNDSNKNISYNNIFYICLDCKKNLCPICNDSHNKTHNIINYEEKFFTCYLHYEQFYSYCDDCKKDICMTCQNEHENHKIIYYIPPNLKKIKNDKEDLFNKKEELKKEIKNIIIKLNSLMEMIDNYYGMYNDIINSYGNKKRNYYVLQNIDNITKFSNYFINDIHKILNENRFDNKIKNIFKIYDKMNYINDNIDNMNNEEEEEKQKKIGNNLQEVKSKDIPLNIKNNKQNLILNSLPKQVPDIFNSKDEKTIINNNNDNSFKTIKYEFPYHPKVGLSNLGDTDYMNAVLQCFCQIEEFANFFKYNDYVNEVIAKKGTKSLTESFKYLIEGIWPEKDKYDYKKRKYAPKEFRSKIAFMNPLFINLKKIDHKDLINFIIMTLHEELNQMLQRNNINKMSNISYDEGNESEVFNHFYEKYEREYRSKISELFYAIQENRTKCLNCNFTIYNFQYYFFLEFPLEEIKKYSINKINASNVNKINMNMQMNNNFSNSNNMMMNIFNNNMMMNNFNNNMNVFYNMNLFNNMNLNRSNNGFNQINNMNNIDINNDEMKLKKLNSNIVSIEDCFAYFQRKIFLFDENQKYCNCCKQTSNAEVLCTLTKNPKILILLLSRGKGKQLNIKLEFNTELDISKFVNFNDRSRKYKLIGVITLLGERGTSGHYIAHCLSPIDGEWYTYNDDIVNECEDFKKNVIDVGMPYLLFYKRID